ncbi:ArsR/SmtB family transcription factor [Streptomyces fulvorobeus]|uniref:DNA-binding transcriptional ArsR family regulator n=1 Tax=Streptomyces fulvorobeus TaxID=284028 RepID=A0A7Y9H7X1_9ACTN|nr:helix-turn-helix transcriptional regulator [Streptomyces fulvorobeus]NYE39473.1 DNA-binding transcriptional ArsR family regulator [Streptomyces fulvorobeus]
MTPASATTDPAAGPRALAHPALAEIRIEGVLHALADPVRLRIVRQLADTTDHLACSTFDLPVSKSTTTHHFRVLRESGVIHQTYRGTAKVSGLRTEDLDALFPGLLATVLAASDRQAERLAAGLPTPG